MKAQRLIPRGASIFVAVILLSVNASRLGDVCSPHDIECTSSCMRVGGLTVSLKALAGSKEVLEDVITCMPVTIKESPNEVITCDSRGMPVEFY